MGGRFERELLVAGVVVVLGQCGSAAARASRCGSAVCGPTRGRGSVGSARSFRWRLVSICSRSPGQGHSNRRTCSRSGAGIRGIPRRTRHRLTVAWATPSSEANSRGPNQCAAALRRPVMNLVADPTRLAVGRRGTVLPPAAEPRWALPTSDPVLDRRHARASPGRGQVTREPLLQAQLLTLPTGQPPTLRLHQG